MERNIKKYIRCFEPCVIENQKKNQESKKREINRIGREGKEGRKEEEKEREKVESGLANSIEECRGNSYSI